MITNNLQFSGHKKIRSHAKKPFSNPLTPNSPAYPLVRSNSQWEKKKEKERKKKKIIPQKEIVLGFAKNHFNPYPIVSTLIHSQNHSTFIPIPERITKPFSKRREREREREKVTKR